MVGGHRLVAPREPALRVDVAFFTAYFLTGPLASYPIALTPLVPEAYLGARAPGAAPCVGLALAAALSGLAFE
jgi:hypothetical protein